MPVPGLMSFEEWKAKAKENAQKNGEVWYEENAPGDYERYVWHAEHPQGDSSVLGKGGTGTDEQRSTGAMPAGTFPDDHPDAGNANTGDPYIDELRSGRVAGSEDWRRFSNAQLKAWQQYYVGGGQFKNKYGDLVGKPIDSGPNTPQGYNGSGEPMSGGGFGGGGGARAAAAPVAPTPAGPSSPLQDLLMNQGGFLRQFDQTPGNDLPGVRGGVLGGSNQGGIWWQGTPGGGGGRPAPNTGVMLPGGSAVQPTGTPRGLTDPRSPKPTGALTPFQPGPAMPTAPRTGLGAPRGTPGPSLTNVMAGVQGQTVPQTTGLTGSLLGGQPGLGGLMSKYQRRRPGAWF